MAYYRPGLFGDRLLLDQSRALDAIYALFTREGGVYATLSRLGGRFTRSILDALLWRGRGLYERLDARVKQHGPQVVGVEDFRRLKLMGELHRHVGDMLALANDVLLTRDAPSLSREGFATVRALIERALSRQEA
jgi:hypothetical protein